jgi:pimeloyl-ACP methyl ester carboxylesterase
MSSFGKNRSILTGILLGSAAALGAAAIFVQKKTKEAERETPPCGNFIEVDGVRLHYIERGEGPCLVLLHGNGTMIQDMILSGVVDLAAQKFRVIVFDRPGYGYSGRPRNHIWAARAQAALIHVALERLEVRRPIVLGHSWGAFVALALGIDFPSDTRSMVLASGYYYPTMRLDVPPSSVPAIPVLGDLMRFTVSPLLGRLMWSTLVRYLFDPSPVTDNFKRFPVWMALRPSQLRASAAETALMLPNTFVLGRHYDEIRVPSVIMAGDGDRHVNTGEQSERFHRQLRNSKLLIVRGAGHMVHQVAPGQVMAAIDAAAEASDQSYI